MSAKPRLSKKQLVREIVKCGKDPIYFLRNYAKISHPIKGLIPFKTFSFQDELLNSFNDYNYNIVLKARQLGISTIVAGYIAWLMMFHRSKNVLVIATKFKTAGNLVKKVKAIIKHLPDWIRISNITVDNQNSFELSNGSTISPSSTAGDAGRSEALSLLVIDEAAFVDGLDELWTGLNPTLSTGGRCIALSTPNGVGNWFHRMYVGAEAGTNNFNPTKIMWYEHPERDQEWFDGQTKDMTPREIAQEHECLIAGTKILTRDGFTDIENLRIGDYVLTHKGRFRKVLRTSRNIVKGRNVRKISIPMSRRHPVYITENHPILTAVKDKPSTQSIHNKISKNEYYEEWKTPSQINIVNNIHSNPKILNGIMPQLDKSVFSNTIKTLDLSRYEISTETTKEYVRYKYQKGKTKRYVSVDRPLGQIVGLFLSEGHMLNNKIQFSFHIKETRLVNLIKNFAHQYNMRVHEDVRNEANCRVIYIANKHLVEIIKSFINGNNSKTKYIRNTIYQTNVDFVKGILEGVWWGDGYHKPKIKNVLGMSNERLIRQIRMLMTSVGLLTRVSMNDYYDTDAVHYLELNSVDGVLISECIDYGVQQKKGARCKFKNNMWWGCIRIERSDIHKDDEDVEVFNVEIEEDHSYIADNLVVHNCNFNMSGETYFDPRDVDKLEKMVLDPVSKEGYDRNVWIWEHYNPAFKYFLVADVARGDGKDYSTFHIFKMSEPVEIVAEYQGKLHPDIFSSLINKYGRDYGTCLTIVENNSIGLAVLTGLKNLEYPKLYYSVKGTHEYIDANEALGRSGTIEGFSTTPKTRPLIISKMEEFIRNQIIIVRSARLISEMRTFIWNNGKPEAMENYNDDLIMACAIGCWVRDTALAQSFIDNQYNKACVNAMFVSRRQLDTRIEGQTGAEHHGPIKKPALTPGQEEAKRQYQKFGWLLGGGIYKG